MELKSDAFRNGGDIPDKYTCDGEDISPPLRWGDLPYETKSLVLIMTDPDAPVGTWTHWTVYSLMSDSDSLEENIPKVGRLDDGMKQGTTDFRHVGYGGPCPPEGKPHHYYFKLYALDAIPELDPKATKPEISKAMEGHVISHAELVGFYERGGSVERH